MIRAACLTVACCSALACADPGAPPTAEQEFVAEQLATLQEELKQGDVARARPLAEVVQLKLSGGNLVIELVAKDVGEDAVIPLTGVKGVCHVQRPVNVGPLQNALRITVRQFDQQKCRSLEINLSSIARVQFDVVLSSSGDAITTQMNAPVSAPLSEDDSANFHVQVIDEDGPGTTPSIQRTAQNMAQLFDENHDQLLESAGEAFRVLRAMHLLSGMSEEEVKQMLAANAPAGDEVQRQIAEAVNQVRADPEVGETQLKRILQSNGPASASALARLSREGWTADLTLRIDNILAPFLLQDSNAASRINSQPHRLIDLLYWPDPSIRAAALDRIRVLSGVSIDIDPAVDPYEQFDRIEALRVQLAPKP